MDGRNEWMDGWRHVDLDDDRRTRDSASGRFDYEGVSETIVNSGEES